MGRQSARVTADRRTRRPGGIRLLGALGRLFGAFGLLLAQAFAAGTASPAAPAAEVGERWWRQGFPPAPAPAAPLAPVPIDPAKVVPDLSCGSLDLAALDGSGVVLLGWAYDPRSGAPADGVIVLDNGRPAAPAVHVFRERPDVAATLKSRRLATSGWLLWLPLPRVTPGRHTFEAYALLAGGRLGRLAGVRSLEKRKGG